MLYIYSPPHMYIFEVVGVIVVILNEEVNVIQRG